MKKLLLVLGLGFGMLHTYAFALPKVKETAEVTQTQESLLWKVTKEGTAHTSYLFGTMHMICEEDFFWTDAMQKALESSEKVCFELDITDKKIQLKVGMGMLNKDGKKLKDYFTEEEYTALEQYVKEQLPQIPVIALPMMRPVSIATSMVTGAMDCEKSKAYEMEIAAKVAADNKAILSVEEPEEQINLFLSIPDDSVVKYINKRIKEGVSEADKAEFASMVNIYKEQNITKLHALTTQDKDNFMDNQAFLVDRNKRWIPKMIAYMNESSVFFAVGAAHLGGNEGVVELLRKEGYKVEAVR
jgi:uncharacterized protein YbaP (TraB family)